MTTRSDSPVSSTSNGPLRLVGCRIGPSPAAPQLPDSKAAGEHALRLIDAMNRRIDVLARDLRVLGYFDDPGDRPRAA